MNDVHQKVGLYAIKQRKRRHKKFLMISAFVLVPIVLLIFYVYFVVDPIVVEATRHAVYSLSTSAVSDAVYEVLGEENLAYDDLVEVQTDQKGEITLISLDTVKLNMMARRFYQVAQIYLDKMGEIGVNVPFGTFTGLPFLIGVGGDINLKLTPIGAMTSTFESVFSSAGINQTKHTLFIRLYASVSMILPCYTKTIDSVTEVLITESIIVGKVPATYLTGGGNLTFSPSGTEI